MTQSQTVTVDQQEILNRANEVEAPMADPPTDVPITPCELTAAKNAAQQLVLSADNMREYLAAGAKERQRLATSLRNAAKAYGEVDEEAATALDNDGEGTVQAESAGAVGGDSSAELTDTPRWPRPVNPTSWISKKRQGSSKRATKAHRSRTLRMGGTLST